MADVVVLINGIVDTVYRDTNINAVTLPNVEGAEKVSAPSGTVFGGFTYSNGKFSAPEKSLGVLKSEKVLEVNQLIDDKLSEGAPVSLNDQTLHVELSDSARADMGGMATTALAAASGAVPWPESYQLGWITKENIRIPLASPSDGLSLASLVGNYYAQVKQNGRSLKDSILNSETKDELLVININEGWPEVVLEI